MVWDHRTGVRFPAPVLREANEFLYLFVRIKSGAHGLPLAIGCRLDFSNILSQFNTGRYTLSLIRSRKVNRFMWVQFPLARPDESKHVGYLISYNKQCPTSHQHIHRKLNKF